MVLAGQPEPPLYFAEMKRINRDGPPILDGFAAPPRADHEALARALGASAVVIDTRPAAQFADGHVKGTLNIPFNKSFSTWAGWLVKYDADIQLIAADDATVARAVRELAMIGLDAVSAWYPAAIVGDWKTAGRPMSTVSRIDAEALAPRVASGEVAVLDVRNRTEFEAGHLPGAIHIPVGYLPERLAEIPRDKPLVVQCQSGARSAIATSVLQKLGITNAVNLDGGIIAWQRGDHPVERDPSLAEV